jgi:hypothetical protein
VAADEAEGGSDTSAVFDVKPETDVDGDVLGVAFALVESDSDADDERDGSCDEEAGGDADDDELAAALRLTDALREAEAVAAGEAEEDVEVAGDGDAFDDAVNDADGAALELLLALREIRAEAVPKDDSDGVLS